jgi:aquaporin rerated protein, other eukaryote
MPTTRAPPVRALSTLSQAISSRNPDENHYGRERVGGRRPLSPVRRHLVAASGEFVGTFFFLYFAYSGNVMAVDLAGDRATGGGESSTTIVILSLAYAAPLLVNIWAFYRISGGLFNPAVSIRCHCSRFRECDD